MIFKSEKTDEKIIRATFKIVQKEGIQKATTKKIAAEAGVNEVTIFRNFENKRNLIETTKEFYMAALIEKLTETFDFSEDETIEDYFKKCFIGIFNFSQDDFSIIDVAVRETRDIPNKRLLISQITDVIFQKLIEFFNLQLEKGIIKDVNPNALSVFCFSLIFESLRYWQLNEGHLEREPDFYADEFLKIIFYGIGL